jgi:hypothetical protein
MSTRHNNDSQHQNYQREAELQDAPEHAYRKAVQHHDKQEHLTPHEQTRQALEHSSNFPTNKVPATVGHGVAAFSHEDIAVLAYQLWEARGRPEGSPEEDWFQAAKELRSRAVGNHASAVFIG